MTTAKKTANKSTVVDTCNDDAEYARQRAKMAKWYENQDRVESYRKNAEYKAKALIRR